MVEKLTKRQRLLKEQHDRDVVHFNESSRNWHQRIIRALALHSSLKETHRWRVSDANGELDVLNQNFEYDDKTDVLVCRGAHGNSGAFGICVNLPRTAEEYLKDQRRNVYDRSFRELDELESCLSFAQGWIEEQDRRENERNDLVKRLSEYELDLLGLDQNGRFKTDGLR